jgi:nicotinamide riboside kinase
MYTLRGGPKATLKLAISGTYSTGKSTTTEALSIVTGIPRTHALTARELLLDLVPGKSLVELNSVELLQLGLRRFEERVRNESGRASFISDGSVIHEWVYGEARMRVGINPGAPWLLRATKRIAGVGRQRPYRTYMRAYGDAAKTRAESLYDAYVHLPVEFPLRADGHRPVSESFRRLSDEILIETLDELGIEYHVVGGPIRERVGRILETFGIPALVPLDDAIEEAQARVARATQLIEEHDRFAAAQRRKSIKRRIAYAMRF